LSDITGKVLKKYKTFLMPESQIRENFTVPLTVRAFHVFQKASTAAHHLEKAAAAVVILFVHVEMRPKVVDTRCENRHLDGSAPDVSVVELVLLDDFFSTDRHLFFASAGVCATREARHTSFE
jgi:hypothetical protein